MTSAVATFTWLDPDGGARDIEVRPGMSLMEAALRAGVLGIEAKCRGCCACVTCHVYVDPRVPLPPPGPMEASMLDFADAVDPRSRLACQVRLDAACDGMVVETPPTQRVLGF